MKIIYQRPIIRVSIILWVSLIDIKIPSPKKNSKFVKFSTLRNSVVEDPGLQKGDSKYLRNLLLYMMLSLKVYLMPKYIKVDALVSEIVKYHKFWMYK